MNTKKKIFYWIICAFFASILWVALTRLWGPPGSILALIIFGGAWGIYKKTITQHLKQDAGNGLDEEKSSTESLNEEILQEISNKKLSSHRHPKTPINHSLKKVFLGLAIGILVFIVAFLIVENQRLQTQLHELRVSSEYDELVASNIESFVKDGLCGFASEAFYADRSIVFMEVGDEQKIHMFSTPDLPSNEFNYTTSNEVVGIYDTDRYYTDIFTQITHRNATVVAKEPGISEITFNLGHNTMQILVIVK